MTKKSFTDNPAINFMSTPEHETATQEPETMPQTAEQTIEPDRAQHNRLETPRRPRTGASRKDCRLNMLVTREMRDQIQALADIDEKSVNSFLNEVIAAYIDSRREEYEQYSKAAARIEAIRRAKREGAGQ